MYVYRLVQAQYKLRVLLKNYWQYIKAVKAIMETNFPVIASRAMGRRRATKRWQ